MYLENGIKGVAHCSKEDNFDPLVGISMAYMVANAKIHGGTKSQLKNFSNKIFKKGKVKRKTTKISYI